MSTLAAAQLGAAPQLLSKGKPGRMISVVVAVTTTLIAGVEVTRRGLFTDFENRNAAATQS